MSDVPYLSLEHPIRLAHRGSRVLWPENTMYGFEGAVSEFDYHYLEIDVHCSRDRVPMVIHDNTLDRTTNGSGPIADWDAEDLALLDAGYRFDPEGDFPMRGRRVSIPTLAEVYAAYPNTHLNIDLKATGIEWDVADVIRRGRADDRSLIGSFRDGRIARFRRITKDRVAVSAGPRAAMTMYSASRIGFGGPGSFAAYQLPYEMGALKVDRRLVEAIHAAGSQIHLWTVNDPDLMHRFLDMDVDGIVTDRPDLLNGVMEEREQSA